MLSLAGVILDADPEATRLAATDLLHASFEIRDVTLRLERIGAVWAGTITGCIDVSPPVY